MLIRSCDSFDPGKELAENKLVKELNPTLAVGQWLNWSAGSVW